MKRTDLTTRKLSRPSFSAHGEVFFFAMVLLVGAAAVIVIKEFTSRATGPALAAIEGGLPLTETAKTPDIQINDPLVEEPEAIFVPAATAPSEITRNESAPSQDLSIRWFNGRAVRPVKTITMLVTAYSPDERSCAGTADGITASNHNVNTNAHRLVAADSRVLPLGSMITIPGYDNAQIVPVLDRGGKIKGNHLDVLFPTHEEARAWGVKRIKVTVWDYADGKGHENWRAIRDSKN